MLSPTYSPAEVAKHLGTKPDTVRAWIKAGELAAVNLSNAEKPRWRISAKALEEFERARTTQPPQQKQRRRKPPTARKRKIIRFF